MFNFAGSAFVTKIVQLIKSKLSKVATSGSYNDLNNKPTSLPADGGNADTVDGKHASDFLTANTAIIEDANLAVTMGEYALPPTASNIPVPKYIHLSVEVTGDGAWIRQTASVAQTTAYDNSATYTRNRVNGTWGAWKGLSAYNPNLLINPDFKINQRGAGQYMGEQYTVDRWYAKWTGFDGITTVTNYGIQLSRNTYNAFVYQAIENSSILSNSTLTFSVAHRGSGGDIVVVSDFSDNHTTYLVHSIPSSSDWTVTTVTFTLGNIADGLAIGIGGGANGAMDVTWAKLEVGSVATPFINPDPATELLKCQRYYYRLSEWGDMSLLATSTSGMNGALPFSVQMRDTPHIKIERLRDSASGQHLFPTRYALLARAGHGIGGIYNLDEGSTLTVGHYYEVMYEADAEIR